MAAGCGSATPPLPPAESPPTAFPGAQGHGKATPGGRGGRIIQVTTLADRGPGSLRDCIDAAGPRVCVFRIGGVIRFDSERPVIRNPYITIAGQTAPGDGILLTHGGGPQGFTPLVIKDTHDVIVRDIRVRTDRRGAIRGSNSGFIIERSHDVILDHVSSSWTLDENVGGYADNDKITISWSIFAEGIPRHDKCALLASHPVGPQHVSFLSNLCAHNGDRNPDINFPPGSCVEIVNNVLYDAESEFAEIWESHGGTPVSIVANYFRAGPSTHPGAVALTRQRVGTTGDARVYQAGNVLDGVGTQSPDFSPVLVPSPPCPLTLQPLDARAAYDRVLAEAGAFPRDAVDARIVGEVTTRTGHIVDRPGTLPELRTGTPYADRDGDGMSDEWEARNGLDPAKADAWGLREDGWTNLDAFLAFAHAERMAGRTVR